MAAAAAAAKVLRGGRSGLASGLLPAIGRRGSQESMLLGSAAATPAGSMGRLMHTGHWRNPALSQGGVTTKPPAKMEQLSLLLKSMKWREKLVSTFLRSSVRPPVRPPPSARDPTARLPRVLRIRIRSRPLLPPFDFAPPPRPHSEPYPLPPLPQSLRAPSPPRPIHPRRRRPQRQWPPPPRSEPWRAVQNRSAAAGTTGCRGNEIAKPDPLPPPPACHAVRSRLNLESISTAAVVLQRADHGVPVCLAVLCGLNLLQVMLLEDTSCREI